MTVAIPPPKRTPIGSTVAEVALDLSQAASEREQARLTGQDLSDWKADHDRDLRKHE